MKKRTDEGSIVILPTDKTGRFAVMDRDSYEEAGMDHVKGDREVGWEDLSMAQKELNGHAAMLIKVFKKKLGLVGTTCLGSERLPWGTH